MPLPSMLKLGDVVLTERGGTAIVAGIVLTPAKWDKGEIWPGGGESCGVKVPHASWELVKLGWIVVDLDNGHWCYGDQVSPVESVDVKEKP